ncbi:Asp23/Gls24 family envelope stress response protein [Agromyces laixinhei]|uniref:Asp23/Gls24 family envelope stress response protein n=1 Tax=Agromyces laixinhei TaxID=2585717 RepID=UPI001E2E4D4F|nr:Asp23/Gls24 family envelope stress response protein [Agromyces laixinhei]
MSETTTERLDCGKTIDELSDYLSRDRIPYNPDIETCPECLNALEALARVSGLSRDLILEDARALPPPAETWFEEIMVNIAHEVRAGRDLPIQHPDPRVQISITEGAVRALLRTVGDTIPGVIVGKCELLGDAERPGTPIEVRLTVSVEWGRPIPEVSEQLHRSVTSALQQHTELNVTAIHIDVTDVHGYDDTREPA